MKPGQEIRRLPDLALPSAPDGTPLRLRSPGREGTVVMVPHSADCQDCQSYVGTLAEAKETLREWDGRVVVMVPGDLTGAATLSRSLNGAFAVVADADGRAAERLGVEPGSMVVSDQWGEVFHVYPGAADTHDLPAPDELAEWLRFMAIQCPECQGEAW